MSERFHTRQVLSGYIAAVCYWWRPSRHWRPEVISHLTVSVLLLIAFRRRWRALQRHTKWLMVGFNLTEKSLQSLKPPASDSVFPCSCGPMCLNVVKARSVRLRHNQTDASPQSQQIDIGSRRVTHDPVTHLNYDQWPTACDPWPISVTVA